MQCQNHISANSKKISPNYHLLNLPRVSKFNLSTAGDDYTRFLDGPTSSLVISSTKAHPLILGYVHWCDPLCYT